MKVAVIGQNELEELYNQEMSLMDLEDDSSEDLQEDLDKADIALAAGLGGPAGIVLLGAGVGAKRLGEAAVKGAKDSSYLKMKREGKALWY